MPAALKRLGVHTQRVVRSGLVRVVDTAPDAPKRFVARVLNYNVVDDYSTLFRAGCFTQSLQLRLPRITWAHDWAEPIGRWVDYEDTAEHLDLIGELDDFDAVPRARQAYAQLRSGTIDQFSVGFMPEGDELVDPAEVGGMKNVYGFTRGRLDEAALVLVGAVPGTTLLAVRTARGVRQVARMACVSLDDAMSVATQMGLGQITYDDAVNALTNAAMEMPEPGEPEPVGDEDEGEEDEAPEAQQEVNVVVNVVTGTATGLEIEQGTDGEEDEPDPAAATADAMAMEADMKDAMALLAKL